MASDGIWKRSAPGCWRRKFTVLKRKLFVTGAYLAPIFKYLLRNTGTEFWRRLYYSFMQRCTVRRPTSTLIKIYNLSRRHMSLFVQHNAICFILSVCLQWGNGSGRWRLKLVRPAAVTWHSATPRTTQKGIQSIDQSIDRSIDLSSYWIGFEADECLFQAGGWVEREPEHVDSGEEPEEAGRLLTLFGIRSFGLGVFGFRVWGLGSGFINSII